LVIGELNGSRYPIQGLSRAKLLMLGLPTIPSGSQFGSATLRLYLQSNTGNAGNTTFGSLSLYHYLHLTYPQITISLTDYADTNYVLVTNSVVTPTTPTGQYYDIDVTAQVAKDYEDGAAPVLDFRFQVDGLQFMGTSHYYEFDSGGGGHPPQLLLMFSGGPSIPIRPLLSLDFQRANSALVLSWPTNYAHFVLESADSPLAPTWTAVTNETAIIDGQFAFTIFTTKAAQFFRLHQK
jgi:hypothetical protein